MINFQFPSFQEIELIRKVQSKEQVSNFLKKIKNSISKQVAWQIYYRPGNRKLVVKCKKCRASLNYDNDLQHEGYLLKRANIFHEHFEVRKVEKPRHTEYIQQYIKTIPKQLKDDSIINLVSSKLRVSKNSVKQVLKKMKEIKLDQVIKTGSSINFICDPQYKQKSPPPDNLLIISDYMVQNYKKYGKTILFELTDLLIKGQYMVGFLLGRNSFYKAIIFGIVIIKQQKKQDYKCIIRNFFSFHNWMIPETFISAQESTFITSLNEIKQEKQLGFQILFDRQEFLRSIKCRNQMKKIFSDLLASRTAFQYNNRLNSAYDILSEQEIVEIEKVNHLRSKVCLAYTSGFSGIQIQKGTKEIFHHRLKSRLAQTQLYHICVKILIQFSDNVHFSSETYQIERIKFQSYLNFPQIGSLRRTCSKQIFRFFLIEVGKIVSYLIQKITNNSYRVYALNSESYIVQVKNKVWKCSCQLEQKTGVACAHLIKMLLFQGEDAIKCIQQIWRFPEKIVAEILRKEKQKEEVKDSRKNRSTRTNRIK